MVALLQRICLWQWPRGCCCLMQVRRLSHWEVARLYLQSFWREQGEKKENCSKWMLSGGRWRGPWEFLRFGTFLYSSRSVSFQASICTARQLLYNSMTSIDHWWAAISSLSSYVKNTSEMSWTDSTKDVLASFFFPRLGRGPLSQQWGTWVLTDTWQWLLSASIWGLGKPRPPLFLFQQPDPI